MDEGAFVGRSDQLAFLDARLDEVRRRQPSVVLVEGPPGVGKTTLVHHGLGRAHDVEVIDASADPAETDVAWGVVDQLARAIGDDAVEQLSAMLPVADSSAIGGWLLGRLGELDEAGPVALVVDDLPWADSLSITALTFALRRLRADRVAAIFTARSADVHTLPDGLQQLVRGPHGHVMRVGGLDPPDVERLGASLGVHLSPGALSQLTHQTEGNPLHLTALLHEAPPESFTVAGGSSFPAPASFRALTLGKLAGCAPGTERLVVALATLGLRAPVAEAAALAGLDDPLAAMDEAVERGLVTCTETDTGLVLAFAHPLTRAAVYNDLGPRRRAEMHLAAAQLATDGWTRLRHLVDASTGPDPSLVEELLAFAAARRGAGPGGTADAGAALRLAARVASCQAEREELILRALECLLAVGDAAGTAELCELIEGFGDSPRLRYTRAALLAINGSSDADLQEAIRLLDEAWHDTEQDDDPTLRAGIATQMATTLINQLRLDEVDQWAVRAVGCRGSPVLSEPTVASAFARAAAGRPDTALDLLPPVPEDGLDLYAFQRALGGGVAELWNDRPDLARQRLLEAYEAARAFGVFFVATLTLVYLSDAEHRLGLLEDAVHHAQLAASTAADSDQAWFMSLSHSNAAVALALRGDADSAAEQAALARAGAFTPAFVLWSQHATAVGAHLAGDTGAALAAVQVLEHDPVFDRGVIPVLPWHVVASQVHLAAGELDAVDQLLERITSDAARHPRPVQSVALWRLRGLRAAAAGDEDTALRSMEQALALAEGCPSPIEVALVQLELGASLRRAGRRREAATQLTSAVGEFTRSGARPFLERAERELSACGLTPAKRSGSTDQLTPQERTVAMLASRGKRTKEIAAELVVSPKTIEYHLGNIYRKLGVTNRAQLVATFDG